MAAEVLEEGFDSIPPTRMNRYGGEEPAAPKLAPHQLFEKRAARDNAKLRAYNEVLKQIHSRIFTTSQLPGNPNYLVYTVPPFILGLPALDLQDCIVYIVHQLRTSGFEVRFTYPNLLYISWKHYEQEYMRERNPITQAMKPPEAPASTSKKGVGGKRGAVKSPDLSRMGTAGAAGPRSIDDYKPPDAFLNAIQRPLPGESTPAGKSTESLLQELWKL
jgi:hypothetical protein